jgi:hypothetical protein
VDALNLVSCSTNVVDGTALKAKCDHTQNKCTENKVAEKIYPNSQALRKTILAENKGKMGVYRWVNNITGKSYIGSSLSLDRRILSYFRPSYLKSTNTIIAKALLKYGHSNFTLEILEYLTYDDSLTMKENNEFLLKREQHFLDLLNPEYNILKMAGNLSGYQHSAEALEKMSESKKGNPNGLL